MVTESAFGSAVAMELEAETAATRKCLERIPEHLFDWKPHPRSMSLGDLSLLVSEMPKWISTTIDKSYIDFVLFDHFSPTTTAELVKHFDENVAGARDALSLASDEAFDEPFDLKNNGQTVLTAPKKDHISSMMNHLVHHRGQLTVYMRLNDILVPSIYGPSADDKGQF